MVGVYLNNDHAVILPQSCNPIVLIIARAIPYGGNFV